MSVRASIVVVAGNGWRGTRDCLTCLAETIRSGDQIIVVDDATSDVTQRELTRRHDVTVVRNDQTLGWAASAQLGLTSAVNPVVVFLDPDTLPTGAWLDLLTEPLAEATVAPSGFDAVAAMSNLGSGSQLWPSPVPYLRHGMRALRAFVAAVSSDSEGELRSVTSIDPFCIAVTSAHARSLVLALASGNDPHCKIAIRTNAFMHRVGTSAATPRRSDVASAPALMSIRTVAVVGREVADLLEAFGSQGVTVIELEDPLEIATRDDVDVLIVTEAHHGDVAPRWASTANSITVALGSDDSPLPTWCDHTARRDVSISDLIDTIERVDSFGTALVQARQRLESGDVVDAIDALTRAEGRRPDSPQVANCLGVCAYLLGDEQAARRSFQRAIQIDPTYRPAVDNLGGLQ